ncbi:MAG: YciI family protein [Gammaproteobacteria bacterium]|nr:YciI family protein [Gammaproteobacteria bacterium]
MYYSIYSEDCENSLEKRKAARTEHMARIEHLYEEGRLLLAGPHPNIDSNEPGPAGFSGSLVVAEFASLQEAQEWAKNDPFQLTGVYEKVSVKPFKLILPK